LLSREITLTPPIILFKPAAFYGLLTHFNPLFPTFRHYKKELTSGQP
jgi:hypothetical protein